MESAAEAEPAGGGAEPPGTPAAVRPVCCPALPAAELAPLAHAVTSRPAAAQATTRAVTDAASLAPVPRIPVTPHLVPTNVTPWTQAAACQFPPSKLTASKRLCGSRRTERAEPGHAWSSAGSVRSVPVPTTVTAPPTVTRLTLSGVP